MKTNDVVEDLVMPPDFEGISYRHVCNFVFVGKVVSFLANHAVKYHNKSNGLLEFGSATGYLSAFKTYFNDKFKYEGNIRPFDDYHWKRYRSKLRSIKNSQAKSQDKLLVVPKSAATDDDRWSIFGICTWGESVSGALLCALMNVMFQVGGRVSEGSTFTKSNLRGNVSVKFVVMF
jgi:hypothetical protein